MLLEQTLTTSLRDPYYIHIGAIIHRWATLEYLLQNIIWKAMDLDREQGRVLTMGMGTQAICGVLRTLPKKWVTEKHIQDDLKELLDLVWERKEFRNYLAHGVWTAETGKKDGHPWLNYMKSGDERITPGAEEITPELLRDLAQLVDEMNQKALALLKKLGGPQPPSREKSA